MRSRLSNPNKLLWPQAGITKADLWRYLERVADRMLAHLADRPLTLLRAPRGVGAKTFLQKNLSEGAPSWLPRHEEWTPSSDRTVAYAIARNLDHLLWLANQNTVEFHPMLVRADRDDRPDLLVFDLDPGAEGPSAPEAARGLRGVLDELGLDVAVKTSGKRGLHLVVPVVRRYDETTLRAFGLAAARAYAARDPDGLTVAMRKIDRGGRLLIDWSRNGHAQTMAAAWSPRATPTATVSVPLSWDEVTDDLDPSVFTISTAPERPDKWDLPPPQRLEQASKSLMHAGFELADASPRSRVR